MSKHTAKVKLDEVESRLRNDARRWQRPVPAGLHARTVAAIRNLQHTETPTVLCFPGRGVSLAAACLLLVVISFLAIKLQAPVAAPSGSTQLKARNNPVALADFTRLARNSSLENEMLAIADDIETLSQLACPQYLQSLVE